MDEILESKFKKLTDVGLQKLLESNEEFDQEMLDLIYNEFLLRGLDTSKIESIECHQNRNLYESRSKETHQYDKEKILQFTLLAINSKRAKKSDEEIIEILKREGIDKETSIQIIDSISQTAKLLADKYDTKFLRGGVLFMIGLFDILILIADGEGTGALGNFLSLGSLIFGGIDLISYSINKYHFENFATKFEKENQEYEY